VIVRNFNNKIKISNKLDPNLITGFSDAGSCFTVIISKRSNLTWRIQLSF